VPQVFSRCGGEHGEPNDGDLESLDATVAIAQAPPERAASAENNRAVGPRV
jgi:hypothetical protein